jgi:polygalacturonase
MVVVRDCRMHRGGGGFAIGSETSGGVNNIYVQDLVMDDPRLLLGILIKSNSYRGGTVRDIYMRRIRVAGTQSTAVRLTYYYSTPNVGGPYTPVFDNINLSDFTCDRSESSLHVLGYPDNPIKAVNLTGCAFNNVARPALNVQNVTKLTLTRVTVNGRTVG